MPLSTMIMMESKCHLELMHGNTYILLDSFTRFIILLELFTYNIVIHEAFIWKHSDLINVT